MPFASMTPEDVQAFYTLLDEYFESRRDMFASWVEARATPSTATPAAAPSPAPPTSASSSSKPTGRMTAPPPASRSYNAVPSSASNPPAAPASPHRSSEPTNKYGITVPKMSDFKDPRFQSAFKAAGSGLSAAGGLVNKHVLKNPPATTTATSTNGAASVGPPPKASKPGSLSNNNALGNMTLSQASSAMGSFNKFVNPNQESPAAAAAPAPPPPPPAPVSSARPGASTCTAQYDYSSAESGDLSFSEGDVITIVSKESDDWWRGSLHGREGLFPASYVQEN